MVFVCCEEMGNDKFRNDWVMCVMLKAFVSLPCVGSIGEALIGGCDSGQVMACCVTRGPGLLFPAGSGHRGGRADPGPRRAADGVPAASVPPHLHHAPAGAQRP